MPPTLTLAEGLCRSVKTYLEANIAAKITALNAEYADAVVLENPRITYLGIKSLSSIPEFPVMYVVSPESHLNPMQVDGTQAAIESFPRIWVGIVALDPEEEPLQLRQYRYARALVELLLAALGTAGLDGWNLGTSEQWTIDTDTAGTLQRGDTSYSVGAAEIGLHGNKIETKS